MRALLIGLLAMALLTDMMSPGVAGRRSDTPSGPPMMDPVNGGKFTKDEQELLDKIDSIERDEKIDAQTAIKMVTPLRQEFLKKAKRFLEPNPATQQ